MSKCTANADQEEEMQDLDDSCSDVVVDDYKDMAIEMMPSSRKKFLQWNDLG